MFELEVEYNEDGELKRVHIKVDFKDIIPVSEYLGVPKSAIKKIKVMK